jgi:YacP-like NYN domain
MTRRTLATVSDEPVVLVDARNAMRSRWPNFREERFLELTRAWGEQEGARLVVVFDGTAPDNLLGVRELDERTTVVGTGSEIADDWIAEHAPTLGDRVWLVSSDRGLRARVAGSAERVIGGGSFAGQLEALERDRS